MMGSDAPIPPNWITAVTPAGTLRGGINYLFFLIQKVESGIDFDLKIADRFLYQNRIAIDSDNFLIAIMGAIAI